MCINKNKISKELKIRCNFDDVNYSTIIIQVSIQFNYQLWFILHNLKFTSKILWELTGLYIIFSYILRMNIFSRRLWHSLTCIGTQWNALALGMAWHLAHFCMPGTHWHFLALPIAPWHSLVIHGIPIICLLHRPN